MENKKRPNLPRPFKRKKFRPEKIPFLAYDLETTRIAEGTPRPLYLTAFGASLKLSEPVRDTAHLLQLVSTNFLTPELSGYRFIAWNGNQYDVYFIALALLLDDRYIMRPYLTRSKSLRGMRVYDKTNEELSWEFLDGMSMTGIMRSLEKFLEVFAPEHKKLAGTIDWDREEFDADNPKHVAYADRDAEGLYWGMQRAESILEEQFGMFLTPTIGNLGIKLFQKYMPPEAHIPPIPDDITHIIRTWVVRGGFCYCARKYTGPIWKADLNQAYAAAMREARLPMGKISKVSGYYRTFAGIYCIQAKKPGNIIPFYYRDMAGHSIFGMEEITATWITSIELEQLMEEGWEIEIAEGYCWAGTFAMEDYVNRLEEVRMTCEGGPNGAIGLLMKAIGNNSYGKTLETLDGVDYLLAQICPEGYALAPQNSSTRDPRFVDTGQVDDDGEPIYNVEYGSDDPLPIWVKQNEPAIKDYHKPQIGAFITAHVRMVLRRAALIAPEHWLYGDTDCVVFSKPVELDYHPSRYGAWKKEEQGEKFRIITKKVYAKIVLAEKKFSEMTLDEQKEFLSNNKNVQHAKGLNVKKLTDKDFAGWIEGDIPQQRQIHKNNLMKVLAGSEMFIERVRKGTKV